MDLEKMEWEVIGETLKSVQRQGVQSTVAAH